MAAYKDAFPAKGLSRGFNSTAPLFEIARRVVTASNVAAPLAAIVKPVHMSSRRRFSARSCSTETVIDFPGLMNAMGADDFTAASIGAGASGRAALVSTADVVAPSEEALNDGKDATVVKEFSSFISRGVSMIDAESSTAVLFEVKGAAGAICG